VRVAATVVRAVASVARPRRCGRNVTYTKDIAPIWQKHCPGMPSPGQVAPFSLLTYDDASNWSRPSASRAGGPMPPWNADPRYGEFANGIAVCRTERIGQSTFDLDSARVAQTMPGS